MPPVPLFTGEALDPLAYRLELELDFKRFELEDDLIRVARSASGSSIGRGILDSQGISADGGETWLVELLAAAADKLLLFLAVLAETLVFSAVLVLPLPGPGIIASAAFCMSLSHFSQMLMLTAGRSTSGVDNGLPGGRFEPLGPPPTPVEVVSGRPSMAEVETDLTSHFTSTLASFVFALITGSVIVEIVLVCTGTVFVIAVMDMDEDFLDTLGEFVEDRRDTLGEFLIHGDALVLFLSGLSTGSNTISATLGDSVSLNAKSSVSVCFEALMTSTHFSVHTPIVRNLDGSFGSSMILQSPTPMDRLILSRSVSVIPHATVTLSIGLGVIWHQESTIFSGATDLRPPFSSSSLQVRPRSIVKGRRLSRPT